MSGAGTVLVLEDEPIIALDVETMLALFGIEEIVIVSSCAEAENWLQLNTPILAIIDIKLRDGICAEVARILDERAVAFIIYSGHDIKISDEYSIFSRGIWVSKPCTSDQLQQAISELILDATE